jgi:hypothetical protein
MTLYKNVKDILIHTILWLKTSQETRWELWYRRKDNKIDPIDIYRTNIIDQTDSYQQRQQ